MDVLKLASEGAAVGHANLEDVANALGAAVASNIKGSDDYQKSMAILNATVGAGNMRMQDLATSLGNVLPQATTAGLSLRDVGAAMATMTDNGMPAADAATRLHMAIALMSAPTGQAQKALESINMTQFQLADDMRNKGLLPALQDLHDHLVNSGKTADEQAAVLAAAFGGGRSAGAIELLLNNLDRVGQKYQLIDEGVNKFAGDVQQQSQTAAAQFAEAQAKMSDALIKLGAALLPLIETVMPKLVAAVTSLVNWFTNLPGPVQTGILIFLGLFAALGPVLVVLGSLITVVGTLTAAFAADGFIIATLIPAIAAIGGPMLIVIAIVAALAIAIYTHWHQIIDWTSDMMLTIGGLWTKGWQAMSDFLTGLLNDLKSAVQGAMNFIMGLINGVLGAINSVRSAASSIGGAVSGAAGAFGGAIGGVIHAFASGGIVTGPTLAMVGEAGPEAIIPLSAFAGGSSLAGAGGIGGGGIVVNITGNNISSQMDLRNIAQAVSQEIVRVLRVNQKVSI